MSEQENVPCEARTMNRSSVCPHCGEIIAIHVTFEVAVSAGHESDWRTGLSAIEIDICDQARSGGLLDALRVAVERSDLGSTPKHIERFFLTFLKTMRPRIVPAFALNNFKELYPDSKIDFYSAQSVGAVASNGKIQLFLPLYLVSGKAIAKHNGKRAVRVGAEPEGLRNWIRLRMGYVPAGSSAYIEQLRKRSIGEFANPIL